MSRHRVFNPSNMTPAIGFSHGAVPADGKILYIAGQTGHHPDSTISDDLVDQFATACRAVGRVIEEAGGSPSDLVSMTIYTSAIEEYRGKSKEVGHAYREVFGTHYPPMALLGVSELFDRAALVELVCIAVVPEG